MYCYSEPSDLNLEGVNNRVECFGDELSKNPCWLEVILCNNKLCTVLKKI